jgi:hypothetical protein
MVVALAIGCVTVALTLPLASSTYTSFRWNVTNQSGPVGSPCLMSTTDRADESATRRS